MENAHFDAVTTIGTPTWLELALRADLGEACRADAIVAEVTRVLELTGEEIPGPLDEIAAGLDAVIEKVRSATSASADDLSSLLTSQVAKELAPSIEQFKIDLSERVDRRFPSLLGLGIL